MPKPAKRFVVLLAILLTFQLLSSLVDISARPAYAAGQLFACLLWVGLAGLTLQGSHGARKFIVFLSCLSMGGAILSLLGGFILLASAGPVALIPIAAGLVASVLCGLLLATVTNDEFCSWVTHRNIARANAKLARTSA